jgi:hypothetical protein
MPLLKVLIKPLGKPMTQMELALLESAKEVISEGNDILFLRLFLEEECKKWKRERIKYKNAPTEIVANGRELVIRHNAADLVKFTPMF